MKYKVGDNISVTAIHPDKLVIPLDEVRPPDVELFVRDNKRLYAFTGDRSIIAEVTMIIGFYYGVRGVGMMYQIDLGYDTLWVIEQHLGPTCKQLNLVVEI